MDGTVVTLKMEYGIVVYLERENSTFRSRYNGYIIGTAILKSGQWFSGSFLSNIDENGVTNVSYS
jgi:hypothetical protein